MAGQGFTLAEMMQRPPSGTAGVPTQSFNASNIIGTPVPVVGDAQGNMPLSGAVGNGVQTRHVVIIAVAIVAIGYLAFHLNFEK